MDLVIVKPHLIISCSRIRKHYRKLDVIQTIEGNHKLLENHVHIFTLRCVGQKMTLYIVSDIVNK